MYVLRINVCLHVLYVCMHVYACITYVLYLYGYMCVYVCMYVFEMKQQSVALKYECSVRPLC
jgi:hypothetical protein